MVKNRLAAAVSALIGAFYLVVPHQEAAAPSFGPDANPFLQKPVKYKIVDNSKGKSIPENMKNAISRVSPHVPYVLSERVLESEPVIKGNSGIEKLLKEDAAKYDYSKMEKKMEKDINLMNEAYTESQDRLKTDSIYRLVTQVYNKLTNSGSLKLPHNLSPEFFRSVVLVESTDTPGAKSNAGAKGYMQVTPIAAEDVNVTKKRYDLYAYQPWSSIDMGIWIYWKDNKYLEENYPGWSDLKPLDQQVLVSRAYNWGISNVLKYPKVALAPLGSKLWTDLGEKLHKNLWEAESYPGKILSVEKEMFPLNFKEQLGSSDAWKAYVPRFSPFLEAESSQNQYQG